MVKFKRVNYDILSSPALQDTEAQIWHFYLHVSTSRADFKMFWNEILKATI